MKNNVPISIKLAIYKPKEATASESIIAFVRGYKIVIITKK